jgi:predicted negative regulator of RcsB-dependent stress response
MAAAKCIHQIAKEHEFSHWASVAPCYIASLIIEQRDYEAGIASMVPAIEKWMGFGMTHMVTLRLANLAHAYGMTGRIDQAFVEINKALTLAQRVGERGYLAEVYRTQGELHSINGDKTAAEVSFEQSIEIARQQEAKLFELQSTLSLCRLYQQQGYWDEAQSRLTTIYNWFTEVFDKPDLVAARTLLEELE